MKATDQRDTKPLAMAFRTSLATAKVKVKGQGQLGSLKCHIAEVCDLPALAYPL